MEVFDGVTEAFRFEVGVERYCNSASFHNTIIAGDIFQAVFHEEGNAVTFLGTDGYEVVGEVVCTGVYLVVGSADLAVDDGGFVRVEKGAALEELVDKGYGRINGNDGSA